MHVNPLAVARVAVGSVLLPLGIGLAVGRGWPAAKQWIRAMQKVSSLLLAACFVAMIAIAWSRIGAVVREGTLTAIVVFTLVGLAVGHVLGGPDEDGRTVLAFATVSRHPGVAMAVASLTGEPLASIGVLLAVVRERAGGCAVEAVAQAAARSRTGRRGASTHRRALKRRRSLVMNDRDGFTER